MATMNRSQFPRELQLGLFGTFGMNYDEWPVEWKDIFESDTSEKAYEEEVLLVGLGGANETKEGSSIVLDAGSEGWVARYDHRKTTIAFAITEEARADNLYHNLASLYAKSAARGMRYKEEVDGANIINTAFTAANGGDGQPLFSTAHPLQGGGVAANTFTTAADLSEESLEDALIAIEGFVDDRGIPVKAMGKSLHIPRQLDFVAHRILYSTLRVGTANNDPNALKDMKKLPGGYSVNHYFADPDFWMIKTNIDQGFRHFQRAKMSKESLDDFDTGNYKFKMSQRYSFGYTNWRCAFGAHG